MWILVRGHLGGRVKTTGALACDLVGMRGRGARPHVRVPLCFDLYAGVGCCGEVTSCSVFVLFCYIWGGRVRLQGR